MEIADTAEPFKRANTQCRNQSFGDEIVKRPIVAATARIEANIDMQKCLGRLS